MPSMFVRCLLALSLITLLKERHCSWSDYDSKIREQLLLPCPAKLNMPTANILHTECNSFYFSSQVTQTTIIKVSKCQ